jgi:hypothetical protein
MTGTGAATDSAHGHDAVAQTAAQIPGTVTGICGAARSFDGIDDSLSVADPIDGSLDFGSTSFSLSLWVFVSTSAGSYDMPLYKGGASPTTTGYDVELGTGGWSSGLSDGTTRASPSFGMEGQHLAKWTQLTAVVDRSAGRMYSYVNGSSNGSTSISSIGSVSNSSALFMSHPAVNDLFYGQLDEVRIDTSAVSANWISAEYQNIAMRAQFMTIGPEQLR